MSSVNRAASFFHNPVFLQLPAFWFVYSQQGFERNNATTSAPIIIQIAIIRILRLALRHRLCSRRSSYSDLPWASPPLATATGRKNRKLIEALQKLVISAASRGIGWGCFRSDSRRQFKITLQTRTDFKMNFSF